MLNQTLANITLSLDNYEIPYAIIGGYAVLFHGEARFTEDIDIVLGMDASQLEAVLLAVSGRFEPRTENTESFVYKTNVLPLISLENRVHVDLVFSFIEFERKAIKRSVSTEVNGKTVKIVKAEDLIVYKLFAARPRDIEDAKNILKKKKDTLDLKEVTTELRKLSELTGNPQLVEDWEKLKDSI